MEPNLATVTTICKNLLRNMELTSFSYLKHLKLAPIPLMYNQMTRLTHNKEKAIKNIK